MDTDVGFWSLWLPIVLSAVAVFIVAFIAHMVVGHHKGDWKKRKEKRYNDTLG